jgi:oligoendopeptidase F
MKKENKTEQQVPDFSHLDRDRVPGEFTWRVEDIYPDSEAWQKDKARLLEMIEEIDRLAGKWTESAGDMYRMMSYLTELSKLEDKTYYYPRLLSDTDMENSNWQGMKGEIHTVSVNLRSKMAFMDPDIIKLGREKIQEYITAEPRLKIYEMDFDSVLRKARHILTADKEDIMAQTDHFSGATSRASGVLNDVEIPAPRITLSSGERIKLNTAGYVRHRETKNRKDRVKVMRTFWKNHKRFRTTHAILLDGAVKNHWFNARVRHYGTCLEAALDADKIDPKVYHTLIETVKANLTPLHRYLKLKARMLNLEKLSYDDIYASSVPGVDKSFTIEEAGEIIMAALKPLGDEYTDILAKGLSDRWMDIYPNNAKRSGAYSNGGLYDIHPYVLMNYNGTFSHVATLAHEFGHALHSWFSNKTQPYPMSHYPIFLAEIASTFNETLLVHHMLKTESDDLLKLYILDRYLDEFRGTLFRQTLFAEFELALHQRVENGQTLTADWLDRRYLELTRHYYGHKQDIIEVNKYIENEWSNISHFYYDFYVYQYSTGIAAATALAEIVLNGGPTERQQYLDFLKSGGSRYPLDTLKDAGVDLTTPEPIQVAIDKFDAVAGEMETILERIEQKKE